MGKMRYFAAAVLAMTAGVVAFAADLEVRSGTGANVTAAIQRQIDAVSAAGGGTIRFPAGEYVVASLRLKDNVTLQLDRGAFVYGSTNDADYVAYENDGDSGASVIQAVDAKNVAIVGDGVVDGRGRLHVHQVRDAAGKIVKEWQGRNVLYFHRCRGIRLEGVSLRCPSSWTCFFRDSRDVTARRVKVWSHHNTGNDGFDIESSDVLVEDCDIDAEDDALVLKSREPDCVVENVTVRRCRFSSNAEHVKVGTETLGTVRNVLVEDCTVGVRTPTTHEFPWFDVPGTETLYGALSAISLFVMDGGRLENVTIRNITVGEGILTPICVRYGDRKPRRAPGEGWMKDILIENVRMTVPSLSAVACSVAGLPKFRPTNVTFRNLDLWMKGGGRAKDAAEKIVEEHPADYPTPYHVFRSMLPASVFYVRHADNVRFENCRARVTDPDEARPPVVKDDATVIEENCRW